MWQSNFYYFDKIPQILYLIFKQLIYLAFSISETMELISTGYITGKKMVPWWKVYELKRWEEEITSQRPGRPICDLFIHSSLRIKVLIKQHRLWGHDFPSLWLHRLKTPASSQCWLTTDQTLGTQTVLEHRTSHDTSVKRRNIVEKMSPSFSLAFYLGLRICFHFLSSESFLAPWSLPDMQTTPNTPWPFIMLDCSKNK